MNYLITGTFKAFVFFLVVLLVSCNTRAEKSLPEDIQVVNFEDIRPYLNRDSDTIYVVNFWATWCKPCVEELPYLEKINKNYRNQKVKVLLVSLDFSSQIESRLKPFIKEHDLKSEIILLDDTNSNYWIEQVDASWTGAIPATVIYGKNFRHFYEKTFEFSELDSIVKSKL